MKLIELTCPCCGAHLKLDSSRKQASCEHCGASLLIDDEVQRVRYENAEEAGYSFEKGRQRAQAEAVQMKTVSSPQKSRKRLTWLWVLGWICIFPVPLTIILLRKKEMKPAIKYSVIAVAWIFYFLIAASGSGNDQTAQSEMIRSSQAAAPAGNIRKLEMSDKKDVVLEVGENTSRSWVNATVKNKNEFSPDDVVFISDDPAVAVIEYTDQAMTTFLYYQIRAVGPGETEVYARSKDGSIESAHRKVTVPSPIEVETVSIEKSISNDLLLGETVKLKVSVSPADAKDKSITWSSSNPEVVSVSAGGEITALGSGTAVVTANAASGVSDSISVNVDASKRIMKLRVVRDRTDDFNIGDEWDYSDEINGEYAGRTIIVSVGDVLQFYSEYTESDDNPDIGKASTKHKITQADFDNGFEVTLELYVRENGGKNSGKSAHFVVTYEFST